MNNNKSGVYAIINNDGSFKAYIGSTKNLIARNNWHFNKLKNNKHYNSELQQDWNKLGESFFSFHILYECPEYELTKWEQFFIDFCESSNKKYGYNKQKLVYRKNHSEETKKKISQAGLGEKNHFYGKNHSAESKHKISLSKKGVPNLKLRGKQLSDNCKKAFLEAARKPVGQYDLNTGKLITVHVGIKEAARTIGVSHHSTIARCANGKFKYAHGFIWRYINNKK
mgnify:CR=1 FL=1